MGILKVGIGDAGIYVVIVVTTTNDPMGILKVTAERPIIPYSPVTTTNDPMGILKDTLGSTPSYTRRPSNNDQRSDGDTERANI